MVVRRVVKIVIACVGFAIVGIGIVAGILYANDYGLEAKVKETHCHDSPPAIDVETKRFGIDHTAQVTSAECLMINTGSFVVYHLRTGRTTIYVSDGGNCIYDTAKGVPC